MLAGRRDVAFLTRFVKDFGRYSDDGETLHAAYGHRWRCHWGYDQLDRLVELLSRHPDSRRGVVAMWDPTADQRADEGGRDLPCNTQLVFSVRLGRRDEPNRLCMTVMNRSNDIIWGLYGANAVHLSMAQEYVAARLGMAVGSMTTVSNNFHAYETVYARLREDPELKLWTPSWNQCPYATSEVTPYPLVHDPESWDEELLRYLQEPDAPYDGRPWENGLFPDVAVPLWNAWAERTEPALAAARLRERCLATDWARAGAEWLERRAARRAEASR